MKVSCWQDLLESSKAGHYSSVVFALQCTLESMDWCLRWSWSWQRTICGRLWSCRREPTGPPILIDSDW